MATIPPHPPTWPASRTPLPAWTAAQPPRHVHLVPSLSLGGAERIVVDVALTLAADGAEADLAVMRGAAVEHPLLASGIRMHRLGDRPWPERTAYAAGLILGSRLPAYAHLTSAEALRALWAFGVRTVPVVHNTRPGWKVDPLDWSDAGLVPFVVACGEQVAEDLHTVGLRKPIRVLRHIVPVPAAMPPERRIAVRRALGAGPGTLLIGMTGRHVGQKHYAKAVHILDSLVRGGTDGRLVIVGAAADLTGVRCRDAVAGLATRLGVRERLVLLGPVTEAADLVRAYDVFLNTSRWEGVSVSTMEAVAAGVPVVGTDVGGQCEAVGPGDTLLPPDTDDVVWAAALRTAACQAPRPPDGPMREAARRMAAATWPWLLTLGPGASLTCRACDVLFVTGNLDVGGAQRSLCNLVAELPARGVRAVVAVCGTVGVPGFMAAARDAGVMFLDLAGEPGRSGGLRGRASRILALVQAQGPRTVCFWNMDAATKLAVIRILSGGPVRVVDVSPGPSLYAELDAAAEMARLLSTTPDDTLGGLDLLVSKFTGETDRGHPRRRCVIPNGVPRPGAMLPAGEGPAPPAGADPALAVVTVGRLSPAKRPRLLPLVARALGRRRPGATLTVVGGTHGTDPGGAWTDMLAAAGGALPANLHFAGPDHRTCAFLPRFRTLYMVSTGQGCPNASLEAMACGLPVVANPDGGTGEQVVHGRTGLLVSDPGDDAHYAECLAEVLASLLDDPAWATALGRAAQQHVRTSFSMATMASAYVAALLE